ncbi:hypothetical protein RvY_02546 [Ramazzottius varieornatus]|uniref:Uncharacterized protein n=1 Tax=Ramazzottius varieornatus TaxID=947166 RepID=A0A1D1UK24_RAMVA|nr:hypothetical protein RvY_02546 [Ramazzottius varieornatus]
MNKPSAGEESEEKIRKRAMDRPFKRRNDELLAKMEEDTESVPKRQLDFLIHDKELREKDRHFQKEETGRERHYKTGARTYIAIHVPIADSAVRKSL